MVLHHRGQGKDHQFGITLAGVVRDMKNVYIIWLIRGLDKGAKLTLRSYLSELRQFAAWCEASWSEGHDTPVAFTPQQITTPLLTQYRSYLQTVRWMQPTTMALT